MTPTIRIPEWFWSSKISKMMNHTSEVSVFQDPFSLTDLLTLLTRCGSLCLMTKVMMSMTEQWDSMMTKTQECWWNSQSPRQLFHNPQSKKVLLRESLKKQPYLLLQPRSRATWTQSESQREQKHLSFLLRPSHRELHLQSKIKISVSHQFAHQWPLRLSSQSSQRWILLQELQRSQAVARLTLQFRTSRLFSIKTLKRDKM